MDDNIESIFIRELNQSFCGKNYLLFDCFFFIFFCVIDYNLNIIDIDENIDCQRMLDILDGRQVGQKHKPTIIDTNDYDKYKQNSIESKMVSPVKSSNNEKQYINLNISPVKLPVKNESSPLKERTNSEPISNKKVFQVIFGQYKPYRKKKEWSYDGFIMVKPEGTFLYNSSGRM